MNINDKKETQDMSDENKKKVVLGTSLALLLGAGSYWFLGSGGGSDSDGLNSGGTGIKVARVTSDEPMTHKDKRRPKNAENGFKNGKKQREPRATNSNGRKTKRQPRSRAVTKKPKTRRPAS